MNTPITFLELSQEFADLTNKVCEENGCTPLELWTALVEAWDKAEDDEA